MFLSKAVECFGTHISKIFIQGVEKETNPSFYRKVRGKISTVKNRFLKRKDINYYLQDLYDNIDFSLWKKSKAAIKYTTDINNFDIQKSIRESNPDLILIFGGKILKGAWIDSAKHGAINLHYGVLPYYRSSHSTEFALYHESYDKIGATIHYIDKGVDTGPIISRHCVQPDTNNFQQLLANVYKAGIDGLVTTAQNVINGENVTGNIEHSEDSYFPGKSFNKDIEQTSNLRLKILNKYRFPNVSRALNDIQNNSLFPLINRKKNAHLQNGIYIFLYHSIVDGNNYKEWEKCYDKILTNKNDFCDHINYLSENANYVKLSEVPKNLYKGKPKEPYYTITFDDGYSNILDNAFEICKEKGAYPTVFVNGDFASQSRIYYRVLLSVLLNRGLHNEINKEISRIYNISNKIELFGFCKKYYSYRNTENIINSIWDKHFEDEQIRCHMDWSQLKSLQENGWEIGNHTLSHPTLSRLLYEQQQNEIEKNYQTIRQNGLDCIKWLSYPNGNPWDINEDTNTWMQSKPDWYGIVVANGYNRFYSKNEYLRIGLVNDNLRQLQNKIAYANYNIKSLLRDC